MSAVTDLKINNVTMPPPAVDGLTISTEKIWSADTGRAAAGNMVGTVIARKTTVKIRWPVLTRAQAALIEQAVNATDFVSISYLDMGGNRVTKTVYFSTPTYTIYSVASGLEWVRDVSVEGIEQ